MKSISDNVFYVLIEHIPALNLYKGDILEFKNNLYVCEDRDVQLLENTITKSYFPAVSITKVADKSEYENPIKNTKNKCSKNSCKKCDKVTCKSKSDTSREVYHYETTSTKVLPFYY